MKTQAECWQALLDGESLIRGAVEVRNHQGFLVNHKNERVKYYFYESSLWSIKPETKTITKDQLGAVLGNFNSKNWIPTANTMWGML